MTDTKELDRLIRESGLTKSYLADKLGLTLYGFQLKRENKNEFKTSEISVLCELLGITSLKKKEQIFFAQKDDLKSTKKGD